MSDPAVLLMGRIARQADRVRAAEAKRCAAFLAAFLDDVGLESAAADLRTLERAIPSYEESGAPK